MAPQILHRVLQHLHPSDTIKPAILHNFQRRRVKYADYPGIIPSSSGNHSVLGTLVSGLSDADIHRLDVFEGVEYEKQIVKVRVLRESSGLGGRREQSVGKSVGAHVRDVLDAAAAEVAAEDENEEVEAFVYVYVAGEKELEAGEWDFESFKRDKLVKWIG